MYLTCPGPVARQRNCEKTSALFRQNQYNSKPHTSPDKLGTSAKVNPPSDNQQAPRVNKGNKNSKNTPSSYSSYSSITAPVLWKLLIKKKLLKKLSSLTRNTWEALFMHNMEPYLSRGCTPSLQNSDIFCTKMINIMPLYVGTYGRNY